MELDKEKVKQYVRDRADHAAEQAVKLGLTKQKAEDIGEIAHRISNMCSKNELKLFVIIFKDLIECYEYAGVE